MKPLVGNELWGKRLIRILKKQLEKIRDPRTFSRDPKISLADCLMSCFAIFSLKWPSLLQYQKNIGKESIKENLRNLYGVAAIPAG